MKILELKSSNIKRLKAVELTLDENQNIIYITGKNAQGKTSVLDSIWYALGGTKIAPEKPIRDGQEKAEISLDLGDYKVTRTYTEKGSYLKVENNEGAKYSNPQDLLNKIVGQLSFDPLEFARMEAKKQVATLVNLTGLDFSENDSKQKTLTEERQFAGRELKAMGEIAPETIVAAEESSKKTEVNITDLSLKIQEASKKEEEYLRSQRNIEKGLADIKELEGKILEIKKLIEAWKEVRRPEVDIPVMQNQLAIAEQTNSEIREGKKIVAEATARVAKQKAYDELTAQLEKLTAEKQDKLKAAKMPIDGLSFTEAGVIYNGIPFEQLSAAEQLKVSMAMAIATNPKLKVILIRDGSLLDKDNMAVIAELAKDFDFQIWIERVTDDDKIGIYIEEGEIKANNYADNPMPKVSEQT